MSGVYKDIRTQEVAVSQGGVKYQPGSMSCKWKISLMFPVLALHS